MLVHPAVELLTTLFVGQSGSIELRPIPARNLRTFVPLSSGDYLAEIVIRFADLVSAQGLGGYFGVAARAADAEAGALDNCTTLGALFVDCDYKRHGQGETLRRLADFPLAPSALVSSGYGVHSYWYLDAPMDARASADVLRRLAIAVADIADVAVSEPARVLRLPGTLNCKHGDRRPVTLDHCDPDIRYSLPDIDAVIPAVAVLPSQAAGPSSLRPEDASTGFRLAEVVAEGDRHATMFALLRSLKARGLSWDASVAACAAENAARFNPPMARRELDCFLKRAWHTPNRAK